MHFKVCKESIQREEVIRNHAINFYAGEIDFDANGTAEVACEQSPEAVHVECTPYQVKTIEVKFISGIASWLASYSILCNQNYVAGYIHMHIAVCMYVVIFHLENHCGISCVHMLLAIRSPILTLGSLCS